MKIFKYVDEFLFDWVFQPLVNTRFMPRLNLAQFCYTGMIGTAIGRVWFKYVMHTLDITDALSYGVDIVLLCVIYFTTGLMGIKSNGLRNPQRVAPFSAFLRGFALVLLVQNVCVTLLCRTNSEPVTLQDMLATLSLALYVTAVYVSHCDDPPPPSRVSKPTTGWNHVSNNA